MNDDAIGCINPAERDPDDLVRLARGEPVAGAERHLERCGACRQQVAEYARLERTLTEVLPAAGGACPPSLVLGDYALDLLPAAERTAVAAHMTACVACRSEMRDLAGFIAEPEPEPAAGGLGAAVRRLLAIPLPPPAFAGLRGEGVASTITYEADALRISVGLQTGAGPGGVIVGSVEGGPAGGDRVATLSEDGRAIASQPVDDLDFFLFEGVPAGTYQIEITLGDMVVVVRPVVVP